MRRTHLRGRDNIRKRIPIHASAFNLSLVLRGLFEVAPGVPGAEEPCYQRYLRLDRQVDGMFHAEMG
jgi:hypothetical protein